MAQYPPLPIFNEEDEQVGEAMLEEILEEGLLHRVIHVWAEDGNDNILLQLRGPNLVINPSKWDFATAGLVDPGETYEQAALRELEEELGVRDVDLENLGVVREREVVNGHIANRFAGTFKAIMPRDTEFVLQMNEVAKIKWFTHDQLKKLINSDSQETTSYFKQWVRNYFGDEDNEH